MSMNKLDHVPSFHKSSNHFQLNLEFKYLKGTIWSLPTSSTSSPTTSCLIACKETGTSVITTWNWIFPATQMILKVDSQQSPEKEHAPLRTPGFQHCVNSAEPPMRLCQGKLDPDLQKWMWGNTFVFFKATNGIVISLTAAIANKYKWQLPWEACLKREIPSLLPSLPPAFFSQDPVSSSRVIQILKFRLLPASGWNLSWRYWPAVTQLRL